MPTAPEQEKLIEAALADYNSAIQQQQTDFSAVADLKTTMNSATDAYHAGHETALASAGAVVEKGAALIALLQGIPTTPDEPA